MAHDVTFRIPERRVGNRDTEIAVREDGDLPGTLGDQQGCAALDPRDQAARLRAGVGRLRGWQRASELDIVHL